MNFEEQIDAMKHCLKQEVHMTPCNCVGPQNGEPLCPCRMRGVIIKNGRYVMPEQDLGPIRWLMIDKEII